MRIFSQAQSSTFLRALLFISFGIFSTHSHAESPNISGGISPTAAALNATISKLASSCVSVFSSIGDFSNDEKKEIILRAYEDLLKLVVSSVHPDLAASLLRQLIQFPLDIRSAVEVENSNARSSAPDLSIHPAILATGLGPSLAQIQLVLRELNMTKEILPKLKEIAQSKLESLRKTTQEVEKQKEVRRKAIHTKVLGNDHLPVWSVAFSSDGKRLVSRSGDRTIRIWNLDESTGQWIHRNTLIGLITYAYSVALSPDGKTLAASSADKTIRFWKLDEITDQWTLESTYIPHSVSHVYKIAFSPDGKSLVSAGGEDKTIYIVKLNENTNKWIHHGTLTGHTDNVISVDFSPDGKLLASGSYDSTIGIWKMDDATGQWNYHSYLTGHADKVKSVVFSPDGKSIASGSSDNSIRIWKLDESTGHWFFHSTLTGHADKVDSVAFSPDGKMLASAGGEDKTIYIWLLDESTGQWSHRSTLKGHTHQVWSIAFSPDGKWIASGSGDKTIRIWNLEALDEGF